MKRFFNRGPTLTEEQAVAAWFVQRQNDLIEAASSARPPGPKVAIENILGDNVLKKPVLPLLNKYPVNWGEVLTAALTAEILQKISPEALRELLEFVNEKLSLQKTIFDVDSLVSSIGGFAAFGSAVDSGIVEQLSRMLSNVVANLDQEKLSRLQAKTQCYILQSFIDKNDIANLRRILPDAYSFLPKNIGLVESKEESKEEEVSVKPVDLLENRLKYTMPLEKHIKPAVFDMMVTNMFKDPTMLDYVNNNGSKLLFDAIHENWSLEVIKEIVSLLAKNNKVLLGGDAVGLEQSDEFPASAIVEAVNNSIPVDNIQDPEKRKDAERRKNALFEALNPLLPEEPKPKLKPA